MNWTKTPPTKPGRYLWRISEAAGDERLATVIREDDELFSSLSGKVWRHVTDTGGEWCGPLGPLEEVEKAYREGWRDCLFSDTIIDGNYATSRARKIVEGEV